MCGLCYLKGAGCKDRTHSLVKCTPVGPGRTPREYLKEMFSDSGKDQLREYWNDKKNMMEKFHYKQGKQ